jgi:hypothetical protein
VATFEKNDALFEKINALFFQNAAPLLQRPFSESPSHRQISKPRNG